MPQVVSMKNGDRHGGSGMRDHLRRMDPTSGVAEGLSATSVLQTGALSSWPYRGVLAPVNCQGVRTAG